MTKKTDQSFESRLAQDEFVSDGTILAVPLCFPGQTVPPPAGETAMTCLAADPSGETFYIGTTGRRAHVLVALLGGDTGAVIDLPAPPDATRIDALAVHDDTILAVASGPGGASLYAWPRAHRRFLLQEWELPRREFEKRATLLAAGAVADLQPTAEAGVYVGLSEPDGQLFRLDLNEAEPTPEPIAAVDEAGEGRFGRRLAVAPDGAVWLSRYPGRLVRCQPALGRAEDAGRVPCPKGRSQHTQVSAWAADPAGRLYGGTSPDGLLFRLDPATGQATPLGLPTRLMDINALTVGHDGMVYGTSGLAEDIGHLFRHEPTTGALRDLGVPVSALAARHYGYHFRCMLTGRDGEILLGQHERVNHLWVYFPPIPRPPAPDFDVPY